MPCLVPSYTQPCDQYLPTTSGGLLSSSGSVGTAYTGSKHQLCRANSVISNWSIVPTMLSSYSLYKQGRVMREMGEIVVCSILYTLPYCIQLIYVKIYGYRPNDRLSLLREEAPYFTEPCPVRFVFAVRIPGYHQCITRTEYVTQSLVYVQSKLFYSKRLEHPSLEQIPLKCCSRLARIRARD